MDDYRCIKEEIITLKPYNKKSNQSFTWLSFPRMQSDFAIVNHVLYYDTTNLDTAGLLVKALQSGNQLPGSCQIPWNRTGNSSNLLPSGIYVMVMRIDGREVESVKVVRA